jgi:hypothetical protein
VATTKTRSAASRNGGAPSTVEKVAGKARGPMIAAGATAAGLAGGLALGARLGSKRRKSGWGQAVEALSKFASATDEVHEIREQLDKANRQSPLEVVLDGLTHRRGAHKRES